MADHHGYPSVLDKGKKATTGEIIAGEGIEATASATLKEIEVDV
jgi:hypothetical protein